MKTFVMEFSNGAKGVIRAETRDDAAAFARNEAGFGEWFDIEEVTDYGTAGAEVTE